MAEIYLAVTRDTDPPRQLAIKVIHQQNAEDPDFVRMLIDEARLAVQLKHPNIVATFDLGREQRQYYLAMEFVDGADLYRVEQRAADQRLSLPIALCAYIAREVARGLDYAHRLKDSDGQPLHVVHRDISPQNVLLSLDGDVKITDFGIAKAARRVEQTQAGVIKGKYYYMSPEQASGQPIDGRTDIFATGILLYEMLVGEMLYYDENVEKVMQAARKADIPPVSKRRTDTPPELEHVVMRALRRRADERYASAADLAQALEDFLRAYAPTFGAADLGAFVERLIGARERRRSSQEPTAAMPVEEGWVQITTPSPTIGLPADALDDLGVRDDNSLIFRRDSRRGSGRRKLGQPRIESPRAQPRGQAHAPSDRPSRHRAQSGTIDSGQQAVPPKVRTLDRAERRSLPGAIAPHHEPAADGDDRSNRPGRDRHALTPKEGYKRTTPSGSTPSGPTGDWAEQIAEQARAGAVLGPSSGPSKSGSVPRPVAVYPALDADREADVLLALAGDLRPPPQQLPAIGARTLPGAGGQPLHPALASRKTLSETFNDEGETAVRPSPLAEILASGRAARSSSEVPALELQQNDEAFTEAPPAPGEPKVELTQVDAPASAVAQGVGVLSVDELDPISAESTHEKLEPPPPRPPSRPSIPPSSSHTELVPTGRRWRRRHLLYIASGLCGALLSAVLSLYWMGYLKRPSDSGTSPTDRVVLASLDGGAAAPPNAQPNAQPDARTEPAAPDLSPTTAPTPSVAQDAGTALRPAASLDGGGAAAGSGRVQLSSKPEGAEVYFEKQLLGTTPVLLQGLPTDHDIKLELKLPGYKTTRKRIHWRGKDFIEASVPLRSKDGKDEATEPGEAAPSGNN